MTKHGSDAATAITGPAEGSAAATWEKLDKLTRWARNPKAHEDRQDICNSLIEFGWGRPLLAREENGEMIAGHGTRKGIELLIERWRKAKPAERAKWHPEAQHTAQTGLVPVRYMSLDERKAHLYALADNRLAEKTPWDIPVLLEVMSDYSMDEVELAGWNADDLADLGAEILGDGDGDGGGEVVEDEVPEPPKDPITKPGDVWILGDHVLVCGDCTDPEVVRRVMRGHVAQMLFTDPPYNLAGNNKIIAQNANKNMRKLKDAKWDQAFDIDAALEAVLPALAMDSTAYVCTSHHLAPQVWEWMRSWADHHQWCVWSKPNPQPSLAKRHWTWSAELVCYGTRGKHTFNFPDEGNAYSVWPFPIAQGKHGHPSEKPVKVPAPAIAHSSLRGDLVLDVCGGTGSTLVACQQLERRARVIEMDPAWCDVIVSRWEKLSGLQARKDVP